MPDGVGRTPRCVSGGKKVFRVYGLEVQGRTSSNMIRDQRLGFRVQGLVKVT